jgi:hypothetical protein
MFYATGKSVIENGTYWSSTLDLKDPANKVQYFDFNSPDSGYTGDSTPKTALHGLLLVRDFKY